MEGASASTNSDFDFTDDQIPMLIGLREPVARGGRAQPDILRDEGLQYASHSIYCAANRLDFYTYNYTRLFVWEGR